MAPKHAKFDRVGCLDTDFQQAPEIFMILLWNIDTLKSMIEWRKEKNIFW